MNQTDAATIQVSVVTGEADFAALKPAWNAVAGLSAASSVFLSYEWFEAAWAWRRLDSELALCVARVGDRIVGILPLIRSNDSRDGARLEMLTVPDTQMSDLIVAADDGATVARAFAEALVRRRDWDTLQLSYLQPGGSALDALVPALARSALRDQRLDSGRNPFVDLRGTWAKYYDGRSRKLKKANNLAANRLKRVGEVRIERIASSGCDDETFRRALDAVIDISRRSWKHATPYSLDRAGPQAFIRSLSQAARDRGWLSIWIMYVGDQAVAMEYQLVEAGEVYVLRADFDETWKDTSPGSYLFRHLLESSFGCGLRRYYMGPGENEYKKRWGDEAEPLQRVIVYNRTLRGRLTWLREAALKPVGRALRDRLAFRRNDGAVQDATESKSNERRFGDQ